MHIKNSILFHKIDYTKNFGKIFNENFSTSKVSSRHQHRIIDWNHNIQPRYFATKLYLYCVIPYKSDHARHAYTTVYRNLYDTNKSYWLYADATFPPPVAKILEVTKINFLRDFERRRRPRLNLERNIPANRQMMTIPRDRSAAIYNNVPVAKPPLSFTRCLNVRYRDYGIPISTRQGYFELKRKKTVGRHLAWVTRISRESRLKLARNFASRDSCHYTANWRDHVWKWRWRAEEIDWQRT